MGTAGGSEVGKAIPIEWIDKHLKWLDSCDNEFAQLANVSIRQMVRMWRSEQNEGANDETE